MTLPRHSLTSTCWTVTMKAYRSKYGAKKVTVDGITFDSQKEYRRFRELVLLERAGRIQDLQRQVKYVLIPAQYEPDIIGKRGGVKRGKLIERECSYIADFVYTEDGKQVVEDTKGFRTQEYIIKRKLMLKEHGIRVREM
jgi:hypothetical protein